MTAVLDVLVVGEVLVELSSTGPLHEAEDFRLAFSGDALNGAAAAAAAGAAVGLLTCVGDDELGARLIDAAAARGIDTKLVRRTRAPNGVYFAGADPHGTREFVYVRRGSAGSRLTTADVEAALATVEPRALLVSGITQALSVRCAAAVARAAGLVNARGGLVVFDPNFRSRLTTRAAARRGLAAVSPYAALVTPSCPADSRALLDTDEPAEAAARCVALGARAAAVTCGANGVVLAQGSEIAHEPAVSPARVVDATGAGDVFAGTVTARLALGDKLADAVRLGCGAAALSLAGQGGNGYLATLAQVREHLRQSSPLRYRPAR